MRIITGYMPPSSGTATVAGYDIFKESLEALLGRPVDLVEPSAMRNPYLKTSIEGSREPVFEADPKSSAKGCAVDVG